MYIRNYKTQIVKATRIQNNVFVNKLRFELPSGVKRGNSMLKLHKM